MAIPPPDPDAWAVVTGASSGIGTELARGLARRGHQLLLLARREERLQELADELQSEHHVRVEIRPTDLGEADDRAAVAADLAERQVGVLCNNAGFGSSGAIDQLDPDRERQQVAVNVNAVHELTLAVLPGMLDRGSGAILIVGSTAGFQPLPRSATYGASKAFANSFAQALHAELGPRGVTVTLLAPGPVKTEFAENAGLGKFADFGPGILWTSAEDNAEEALKGLERGHRRVIPGPWAKVQTLGGRYAPRRALLPLLRIGAERLR